MAIPNKYEDSLDNLIDSSDTESQNRLDSPDRPGLIDKGSCNVLRSQSGSPTLSEEDCLDKEVLVTSLEPVPKI